MRSVQSMLMIPTKHSKSNLHPTMTFTLLVPLLTFFMEIDRATDRGLALLSTYRHHRPPPTPSCPLLHSSSFFSLSFTSCSPSLSVLLVLVFPLHLWSISVLKEQSIEPPVDITDLESYRGEGRAGFAGRLESRFQKQRCRHSLGSGGVRHWHGCWRGRDNRRGRRRGALRGRRPLVCPARVVVFCGASRGPRSGSKD